MSVSRTRAQILKGNSQHIPHPRGQPTKQQTLP